MKKINLISILLFVTISFAFAQNNSLKSSKIIFVKTPDVYDVYIDGSFQGKSPIVLSDLSIGQHLLEVKNDELYAKQELLISSGGGSVTVITPEMKRYTGSLSIITAPVSASVYINGELAGTTPFSTTDLFSEELSLTVKLDGYFTIEKIINIPRLKTLYIDESFKPAFQFILSTVLPENTIISIYNDDTNMMFSNNEEILLPNGKYTVRISNSLFKEFNKDFEIKNTDVLISPDFEYFTPSIQLAILPSDVTILINNKDYTGEIENNSIQLFPGEFSLILNSQEYLPFTTNFSLAENQVLPLPINLQKNKKHAYKKRLKTVIPIMSIGAAVTIASLILNLDSVSISLTDNYSTYSAFKYVTLGTAGAGLLTTVIAGIFLIPPADM